MRLLNLFIMISLVILAQLFSSVNASQEVTVLENDSTLLDLSNTTDSFSIYKIIVPNDNYNLLLINTGDFEGDGDCDVYIQHESIPTEDNYDYALVNEGNTEGLFIPYPAQGEWYIMLLAYESYSNVAMHILYDFVEIMELSNGSTIRYLNIDVNTSMFFEASIPEDVESITIKSFGGTGDATLYAYYTNSEESKYYFSDFEGNEELLTIEDVNPGKWYFELFGNDTSANVSIQASWDGTIENTIPIAYTQNVTTKEDESVVIVLNAEDFDGDTLLFTIIKQPSYGTLSNDFPNPTYTPNQNYVGLDSFTFKVNDGKEDSNIATVYIDIQHIKPNQNIWDIDSNNKWSLPDIIYGLQMLSGVSSSNNDKIQFFLDSDDNFNSSNTNEKGIISQHAKAYLTKNASYKLNTKTCDNTNTNKWVVHTFLFKEYIDRIVSANIRLKAKPLKNDAETANDHVELRIFDDEGVLVGSYAKRFGPKHNGDSNVIQLKVWSSSNFGSGKTFEIELNSLIEQINRVGNLTIITGDDTNIDYILLELGISNKNQ